MTPDCMTAALNHATGAGAQLAIQAREIEDTRRELASTRLENAQLCCQLAAKEADLFVTGLTCCALAVELDAARAKLAKPEKRSDKPKAKHKAV